MADQVRTQSFERQHLLNVSLQHRGARHSTDDASFFALGDGHSTGGFDSADALGSVFAHARHDDADGSDAEFLGDGMKQNIGGWTMAIDGVGLAQPAVKCRGREYLRIIYGPDYTADENLSRLRQRGLGQKRSLALGEFALGIEGLERFVRREPLRRVHECVFGVLALESEPVDPRL